jgi:hypothetical protein
VKPKKKRERLKKRIEHYENMIGRMSQAAAAGYRKPGSVKK